MATTVSARRGEGRRRGEAGGLHCYINQPISSSVMRSEWQKKKSSAWRSSLHDACYLFLVCVGIRGDGTCLTVPVDSILRCTWVHELAKKRKKKNCVQACLRESVFQCQSPHSFQTDDFYLLTCADCLPFKGNKTQCHTTINNFLNGFTVFVCSAISIFFKNETCQCGEALSTHLYPLCGLKKELNCQHEHDLCVK